MEDSTAIPTPFIWRRLHSLTGFFLVLYLIEHLFVNSQAALFLGEHGAGFVRAVNSIHEWPYLKVVEIGLLGIPILIHGAFGVRYLWTAQSNSYASAGNVPSLPEYSRNRAYTWQRITSWILLAGIILHVVHMRFVEYPASQEVDGKSYYAVRLENDKHLDAIAQWLHVKLFAPTELSEEWKDSFKNRPLEEHERLAVVSSFGAAELLVVRETFKIPLLVALYTIFVLAACYHGFNGLWTAMITWGITLTKRSQRLMLVVSYILMAIVAFFGLAAIWGS